MIGLRVRCHRAARELQAYLDGEVDDRTWQLVAAHLEECRRCGLEVDAYAAIKVAVAGRGGAEPVGELDPAVLARLDRFVRGLSLPDG